MKICPNCNSTFNDADTFCENCGAKLEDAETIVVAEPETAFPVPKKKKLLWWHILLIVLAVVIVAGIVFAVIYFTGNDDKNPSDGEEHSQVDEDEDDDEKTFGDKTNTDEEGASASVDSGDSSGEDATYVDDAEVTTIIAVVPGDGNENGNKPGSDDNGNNSNPSGNGNGNSVGGNNTPSGGGNTSTPVSSVDASINAFMSGKYYMSSYDSESGANEMLEMAINGDNFQINMESEGMEMSIIVINNATYLANNKGKYISLDALTDLLGEEGFETDSFTNMIEMLDVSKYNFTKNETGMTQLGGENMNYKKYIASDAELYFYYTSSGIRQIELVTGDENTDFAFVVDSFSATVPSDMITLSGLKETSVLEFAFDMMQ